MPLPSRSIPDDDPPQPSDDDYNSEVGSAASEQPDNNNDEEDEEAALLYSSGEEHSSSNSSSSNEDNDDDANPDEDEEMSSQSEQNEDTIVPNNPETAMDEEAEFMKEHQIVFKGQKVPTMDLGIDMAPPSSILSMSSNKSVSQMTRKEASLKYGACLFKAKKCIESVKQFVDCKDFDN